LKNIRTWVEKLNIIINIINIIKFINIMKIKKNTIEKNIHLILREKSFVIILINLGQASSSKPKKIGAVKVCVTHVAECGTTPPTKAHGSSVQTQGCWIPHSDPKVMRPLRPSIMDPSSGLNSIGSCIRIQG
jgi:hypothetical protein